MRNVMIISTLGLTSCTSPYPASVPDIPTTEMVSNDIVKKYYINPNLVKGEKVDENNLKEWKLNHLDHYTLLTYEVRAYNEEIQRKIKKLFYQKYSASDIGLLGTLTSVIAAASGALTTALYSGGVAISGSVVEQRYNYDVQILNYRTISYKLNCIYTAMTNIPASERNLINEDTDRNEVVVGILEPYLRGVLYDLKFELESQQATVSLVAPDIVQLKKLLNSLTVQEKKLKDGVTITSLYSPESQKDLLAIAEKIRAQVGICKISPTILSTGIE